MPNCSHIIIRTMNYGIIFDNFHRTFNRILKQMEKLWWKQVRHNDRRGIIPSLRWGHSCCVIEDQVVYFAGYADSNYMNDVWTFNTITMQWTQIQTSGDQPSPRSNCSMNFDRENNRVIVFGGGGANKQRFNTINILDWKTKQWMQIAPRSNQPAPWERTYHTAQLHYPYLIVFGGEGVSDLDDLWIFNFMNMSWTEVPISKQAVRPCARRFHSSALVNNQFYVIAGCYSKYRCLSDIYCMDISSLLQTGKVGELKWQERKMKDNTFLTRWGHTSAVYQSKIYVFGGRFCNDLNDILVIDPSKDQITTLKVQGELPKARRRHSACFLGSSMLVFGGFNGDYFNDLYYITIVNSRKKIYATSNITAENVQQLKKINSIEWQSVQTKNGEYFPVCQGLLVQRFDSREHILNFLTGIDKKYTFSQLQELMLCLYRGYGKIDNFLIFHYGINICEFKEQMDNQIKRSIAQQDRQVICTNKRLRPVQSVILLDREIYNQFLQAKRNQQVYHDIAFNLSEQYYIPANKAVLALSCPYFANILSQQYQQKSQIINLPISEGLLFQTLINFLSTNFVVACKDVEYEFWLRLAQMAEYFSLPQLVLICENQLLGKVTDENCQKLLIAALDLGTSQLAVGCAQQIIKNMVKQVKEETIQIFPQMNSTFMCYQRQQILKQVYGLLRFDILQRKIDSQEEEAKNIRKKVEADNSENQHEEKENFQIN